VVPRGIRRISIAEQVLDADTVLAELLIAVALASWGFSLMATHPEYGVPMLAAGLTVPILIHLRSLRWRRNVWAAMALTLAARGFDALDEGASAWAEFWVVVVVSICVLFVYRLWADVKLRERGGP
jgi:hypothetical protein